MILFAVQIQQNMAGVPLAKIESAAALLLCSWKEIVFPSLALVVALYYSEEPAYQNGSWPHGALCKGAERALFCKLSAAGCLGSVGRSEGG